MKKQLQKAGFTLIELIVVIAILGVLAGGAAVGYSGYVKKANKAADQQLVGSIERALDVGSYAFDIDNVLQLGGDGLKLPVGFVVLTSNGTTTRQSDSEAVDGGAQCEVVTYQQLIDRGIVDYVIDDLTNTQIIKTDDDDIYAIINMATAAESTPEGAVCITHSDFSNLTADVFYYPGIVGVDAETFNSASSDNVEALAEGGETKKVLSVENDTTPDSYGDSAVCAIAHNPNHKDGERLESVGQFQPGTEGLVASGEVANAMAAAFGENWENELRLKYDGWAAEGIGNELGTLYAGCSDVFDLIEEFAIDYGGAEKFADQFNSAMKKIPEEISTKEEFTGYWNEISDKTGNKPWDAKDGGNYGGYFVGNASEWTGKVGRRAANAAMTLMYNAGFTTWMQQQTAVHNEIANVGRTAEAHAKAILGWGDKVDYPSDKGNDPYTLCKAAFTDSASKLPVKDCTACKELYEKYVSSGACAANASAAYDTFQTIHDTGDEVMKHKYNDTINYFDYYKNYMTEFKNMFGGVQKMANNTDGSCIIIAVYRTGSGAMDYDVYPAAADPRKS